MATGTPNPATGPAPQAGPDPRLLRRATDSQRALADLQKKITKNIKESNLSLEDQTDLLKDVAKNLKVILKEGKEVDKSFDSLSKHVENTKGNLEKLGMEKALNKADFEKLYKSMEEIEFGLKEINKLEVELTKNMTEKDRISAMEALDKLQKEAVSNIMALNKTTSIVGRTSADLFSEWTGGFDTVKNLGKALSGSPQQLMEQAKNAKEVSHRFKEWGGELSNSESILKRGLGGAFKSLGGQIGGLGKLLGGWPGLIAMAAIKIVDMYKQVDNFIKNANKAFASVRGPDLMTRDVARQFKEFNDQVYDIRENLKVGLDVDQVRGFLEAVSQSGLQIQELTKGVGGYRTAVDVAAKASRNLGIDIPNVGNMMSELMTNFKMDLGEVDKSFVQVAFDAGKSGLTTDRFYGAVKNATSGLAFYGKFLDAASRSMRALTTSQTMGAQEAEQATEEMFQLFKKNSIEANSSILGILDQSGEYTRKAFAKAADKAGAEIKKLENEAATIKVNMEGRPQEEVEKNLSEIANRIAALQSQQKQASAIAKSTAKGTQLAVMAAPMMAMIADDTPDMLMDLIKKVTNNAKIDDIDQEKLILAMKANGAVSGATEELTKELLGVMKQGNRYMENSVSGFYKKILKFDKTDTKKLGQMKDLIDDMNKLATEQDPDAIAKGIDSQTSALIDLYNINDEDGKRQAKDMVEAAKADDAFRAKFEEVMKKVASNEMTQDQARDALQAQLKISETGAKRAKQEFKLNKMTKADMDKRAKETMDEMINQTMSLDDAWKIAKEGAQWGMLSAVGTTKLVSFVSKIIRMLGTIFHDPEEERARKALIAMGYSTAEQQVSAYQDAKSQMSEAKSLGAQQAAVKAILGKIAGGDVEGAKSDIEDMRKQLAADSKSGRTVDKGIVSDLDQISAGLGKKDKDLVVKEMSQTLKNQVEATDKQMKKNQSIIDNIDALANTRDIDALLHPTPSKYDETPSYDLPLKKQNLREPIQVTSPGQVTLHPGEAILPKDYSQFRALPMKDMGKGATTPATGSKTFNINVSATETNLAQKIANEIRGVMYRESLMGAG